MKKYIILIFILIFILIQSFNLYSIDWKFVQKLNTGNINDMGCFDSVNCYCQIQQPGYFEIYNTTDAGKTWFRKFTYDYHVGPLKGLLNAQRCVAPSKNYYYAIFWEGCNVAKSSDGAATFKKIKLSDSTSPYEIVMRDSLNGLIFTTKTGGLTNIYSTNDGWETFTKYDSTYYGDFHGKEFTDNENIQMMYGFRIDNLITNQYANLNIKDQKSTPLKIFYLDTNQIYRDAFFEVDVINDSITYMVGSRGMFDSSYRTDVIYKTYDGGRNWQSILDSMYEPRYGLDDIAFYDEKNGVAVGKYGKILTTNNGGKTWIYNDLPKEMLEEEPLTIKVAWAGKTPIIGTWDGNIYRYEGNFFRFVKEPEKVSLITPANNATKLTNKLIFNWSDNNSNKYYFQISKATDFQSLAADTILSKNHFELSNLESFTNYYWRVGIKYNLKMIWSDNFSFKTKLLPCSTINPECGSIDQNTNPTLEWTTENGSNFFRLEYAKSPDFLVNRILIDSIMISNITIKKLDSGTTYYWHIQAFNYAEASDWSEACDFTTTIATSVLYNEEHSNLILKPNPSSGNLSIEIHNVPNQILTLKLTDLIGNVIYNNELQPSNGSVFTNLTLQKILSGSYIVTLQQTDKIIYTENITIVK